MHNREVKITRNGDVEFVSGKHEYDYEVNAETGKIIKAEKEVRDW